MVNLDDPQVYRQLDPGGMLAQLHGFPEQCRTAWQKANGFKLPRGYAGVDKVVILGMGGSAIGGDLLRSLLLSNSKPIVFVARDYDLPAFVDDKTLVIASSYSGNTEETLSAFEQALKTGCKKIAITTGGRLKELADEAKVPAFIVEHKSSPRAALGYSLMPLIAFMQQLGFLKKAGEVEEMLAVLENALDELREAVATGSNQAKQLARKLLGKIAVIYGSGVLSDVARRWKTQINENSKSWAFYEVFPELNHNAVVGYQFPHELASKMLVIILRCPSLHHRTQLRHQITGELLEQSDIAYQIIDASGRDALSQMMSLVFLGDWVSYYLSILYQTDPTPVKPIDYLKKRLSEAK
ncbi:MAG: bifunctional phosphoglucose/phosphomannose isomerase [Chloroflexi bacterium]|nr:bifunctional phosphoglucose/phosphomannose isomerase [Chloroflexota bacterium]MBM3154747.1 bifunctional phosphoglucose/phosphomannose isomerase [Chloroflexota bacterium]MBM3173523.1 bifunctional phosphoglucose/phosphomannose isomerase [Chloroflexota bacterium]MBM4450235.1 bifunctional phosphoglucose/phosphomannose isomerase [Chloroflexota bacterium]